VGAILFGLGMDRLGMALGYPVIMGLIAALGSLIPLLVFFPQTLVSLKGLVLLLGTALVIVGIVVCSMAGSRKTPAQAGAVHASFRSGLLICISAGILSCLPNVGVAFGANVTRAATNLGISEASSGNVVWALLFTAGFVVNFAYCLFLMLSRRTASALRSHETPRNLVLSAAMALMWIASFYLYGAGAAKLGRWGVVVGWPLFISLSIVMGNVWGLWRGEWEGAPAGARRLLNRGLLILIIAVAAVAFSNRF
jgi:L-rhamnose-H+ transport protein